MKPIDFVDMKGVSLGNIRMDFSVNESWGQGI